MNPTFSYKPYYMEPQKGDDKANARLREALKKSSKIGGAKVVSKRRQYLAALKPHNRFLVLELMHFADELIDTRQFKVAERYVGKKDLKR
ncbi:MAG: hypothetical protein USCGTAYLOR_00985 [Chromatiales bacterium USCg_Taylor]|nr:MAG: hypothetical protein USCGTAYLOR_00985 [Chromatiales bacterium USCg_Taylor]